MGPEFDLFVEDRDGPALGVGVGRPPRGSVRDLGGEALPLQEDSPDPFLRREEVEELLDRLGVEETRWRDSDLRIYGVSHSLVGWIG